MSYPQRPQTDDITSQDGSFIQLVSGKKVIILPNDPASKRPEDDYVLIRTAKVAAIENMSIADLLVYYGNILAIETKSKRYSGRQWDALIEGLDTLRVCSEIFSANPNKLCKIVEYMQALVPRYQRTLFAVVAAIFETFDWMRFEREAVWNQEFEISAVIWAFKIGLKGLALGRAKGKTEIETLLAAEEAWVASHEDTVEYDSKKEALKQFATGVVQWGNGVAGLFAAK